MMRRGYIIGWLTAKVGYPQAKRKLAAGVRAAAATADSFSIKAAPSEAGS